MRQFTVFGNPIEHSVSPILHNAAFKTFGIKADYSKTLLENGNELKLKFLELKLSGANVTVPHKEVAYKLCDEVRGIANNIQAVNTIVKKDNQLIGFNTDAGGFLRSINEFGDIKNALVLGAGGTAKATALIMIKNGIKTEVLNRSSEKLSFFKENGLEVYSHIDFIPKKYDLIVNTTSAGLKDENLPAPKELLKEILKEAKFGFDVIYGKKTPFLHLCEKSRLICKDGFGMLIFQAALAFNLFFDNAYDENKIVEAMRKR